MFDLRSVAELAASMQQERLERAQRYAMLAKPAESLLTTFKNRLTALTRRQDNP